jgi:hypothetical protein
MEPGQRFMRCPPRRWANINPVYFHPGVRRLIACIRRKANDHLGGVALFPQEAEEHECPHQAGGLKMPHAQPAVDGPAQAPRRMAAVAADRFGVSKHCHQLGQRPVTNSSADD